MGGLSRASASEPTLSTLSAWPSAAPRCCWPRGAPRAPPGWPRPRSPSRSRRSLLYPLRELTSAVSLGVVYLLSVLLVSTYWGALLGSRRRSPARRRSTSSTSRRPAASRSPTARTGSRSRVYIAAAIAVSTLAEARARARANEAEQRRREAELARRAGAAAAGSGEPREPRSAPAAQRIAAAFELPSAAIVLSEAKDEERRIALPLRRGEDAVGALLVPRGAPAPRARGPHRSRRPGARDADGRRPRPRGLTREVVESSALRRSDELKTAILRAVSHDLRSPLTAMVAAGEALGSPALPGRGPPRAGGRHRERGRAADAPDREAARPVAPGGRHGRAPARLDVDRGGHPRGHRRRRRRRGTASASCSTRTCR